MPSKVTKEFYQTVKKELKTPADDAKIMEKYGIGKTTTQKIRNTKNYDEYCARTFRYHGFPRKDQRLYRPEADRFEFDRGDNPLGSMRLMVFATILGVAIIVLGLALVLFTVIKGIFCA